MNLKEIWECTDE